MIIQKSEAIYKSKQNEKTGTETETGIKILTPKQML